MTRVFRYAWAPFLAILVTLLPTTMVVADEVLGPDVINLAEWNEPPLHLKVLYRAPLRSTRDPRSMMTYLTEGQPIEVIGLGETQDYVKARVATGPVQGWVDADALAAPPTEFVARLRDRRQKAEAHRDLIERHEVVAGMTRTEVRASLGKPDRMTRIRAESGEEEQWVYTTYKYEPHYTQDDAAGQSRQVVSYRRVRAGHKIITFRNDEVVEIGDDQTGPPPLTPLPPGPVVP